MPDILKAQSDYIVIPVNTVGAPGAGLAKQWADKEPDMVDTYKKWCENYHTSPQQIMIGKYILVPTKGHWREKSNLENVRGQVNYMYHYMIPHHQGKSVAISAIGAGLGGLDYETVAKMLKTMGEGALKLYGIHTDFYLRKK